MSPKSMTLVTKEATSLHCRKKSRSSEEKKPSKQKYLKVGGKKKVQPLDWCWTIIPTQKFFSKHISIPTKQNQGFQMTPPDKPLFFLEDSIRKSRLIDLGRETVQAFGFWKEWISNQLSVSWYLLPVITSLLCAPIGEGSLFYFPQELGCVWYEKISSKAVPGISSPLCSGSQALLTDKENVLCVRPWHSHNINSLSSRLLCTPSLCCCCISFPCTLKDNAESWHWPPGYAGLLQNQTSKSGLHVCFHRVFWGGWTQSGRGICSHNPGILCCHWAVFHKKNYLFIYPTHKKCLTKIFYSSFCQFSLSLLFLLSEAASFEWVL